MVKEVIINEGSHERLQWRETLEEKEDVIIYNEWRMGDNININGNDDCDSIVTIKKEDLKGYTFETLLLVLKNFDEQMCLSRFTQFLKDKKINYDFQAW
jgi:hypothetical protein